MLTDGNLTNPDLKVIPIWIRDDTGVDKPYFFADLTEKKQPGVVISIRGNETWVATVQDWIGEFPEEIAWPEDFDSDGYSAVALKTDFPAGSSLHKIVKGDPCQQLAYWLWEQFTPYSPAVTTLDEVMMWSEHVRPYPPPFNVHAMTPMGDYKPRSTRLRGTHWANDYGDSEHKRNLKQGESRTEEYLQMM
ncbi:hypothetical protein NpNSSI1_00004020 [Neofusicoccum parvum]|nr:hypothetical protein NpNSSI1_00004020 [Neofusicoccum parvum]